MIKMIQEIRHDHDAAEKKEGINASEALFTFSKYDPDVIWLAGSTGRVLSVLIASSVYTPTYIKPFTEFTPTIRDSTKRE